MKFARPMNRFVKRAAIEVFCRRLFACLLGVTFASSVSAAEVARHASLSLGYRLDTLDWNINGAGNPTGSEPNILSELEWRDMGIYQLKGEFAGTNADNLAIRAALSFGRIFSGENQDSDYAGDNRTLEFSRSLSDVNGGRVLDLSGGLGRRFFAGERREFQFIPMIGYSYHRQQLRMRNGNQVLWDSTNASIYDPGSVGSVPLGPFSGLNSRYDATWSGPWVGLDSVLNLQGGNTVSVRVEAHHASYFAQANWNLRDAFAHPVSFEHEATGRGWVLELAWSTPQDVVGWQLGANVSWQRWTTNAGIDRTYLVDPGPPCFGVCVGRLNEAKWLSRSINLTLRKAFAN